MTKRTETRAPTASIAPFGLRMQESLRARLEDAAASAGRSLNAEIVARLEASFELAEFKDSMNRRLSDFDAEHHALLGEVRERMTRIGESLGTYLRETGAPQEWVDRFAEFVEPTPSPSAKKAPAPSKERR